jgi:anti-sigma regulatory factor (Ser/Thr protein kinase)
MTERFELRIPPSPASVAAARAFVVEVALQSGWFDDRRIDDLRLLVSEVTTNAVRAQLARGSEDPIDVWCVTGDRRLEVWIRDHAGGFVMPDPPPEPDPARGEEGGFGLPIIVALADETEFEPADGGTVVKVVVLGSEEDDEVAS